MSEDIPAPQLPLPLLWAADARPMLDAPYVVKNVIGPGELVVIYGAPKSGKTFFATDLALRVAAGLPWFSHTVRSGLVIYVASEMGNRVQRRVYAWMEHHAIELPANRQIPYAIVPKVVNLLDEVSVERLFATLQALTADYGVPFLVVVDTLARSMSGGDENTAQDMGRAIAVTDRLRDTFGTATALVHHAGKDPGKGTRGSSALLGAVDAAIFVEADDQGNHRAQVEWSRDGEAGRDYAFRLPVTELGQDADAEVVSTCVLLPIDSFAKPSKPIRVDVALESLREGISEHGLKMNGSSSIPKGVTACTLDQWRARWCLRTGYDEAGNTTAVNFYKDKAKLLASGKIQISKPYVWINGG